MQGIMQKSREHPQQIPVNTKYEHLGQWIAEVVTPSLSGFKCSSYEGYELFPSLLIYPNKSDQSTVAPLLGYLWDRLKALEINALLHY